VLLSPRSSRRPLFHARRRCPANVRRQFRKRRRCRTGKRTDNEPRSPRKCGKDLRDDRPQSTFDGVPGDGVSDRSRDGKTHNATRSFDSSGVHDDGCPPARRPAAHHGAEVRGRPHPQAGRKHLGRQAFAALSPTGRQDRPSRTRTHAQPETVHLGATAVVRLKRTLAHEGAPGDRGS
jgi:hypothetical protein